MLPYQVIVKEDNLETKDLRLRRFRPEDAAGFLELAKDCKPVTAITWQPLETLNAANIYLREHCLDRETVWAVTQKKEDRCIGILFLTTLGEENYQVDCLMGEKDWENGNPSQAIFALLEWAFLYLGADHVKAVCSSDDLAAVKTLEKSGFYFEKRDGEGEGEYNSDLLTYGAKRSKWKSFRRMQRP